MLIGGLHKLNLKTWFSHVEMTTMDLLIDIINVNLIMVSPPGPQCVMRAVVALTLFLARQ